MELGRSLVRYDWCPRKGTFGQRHRHREGRQCEETQGEDGSRQSTSQGERPGMDPALTALPQSQEPGAPGVQAPSRLAGGNTFLLCKPPALGLCYGSLSKLTGGVLKPFQLLLLPEDPFHGRLGCYQQAARPCSAPWHPLGSLQLRELCPHNLNLSAPLWVRRSHHCPFSSPSPVPEL